MIFAHMAFFFVVIGSSILHNFCKYCDKLIFINLKITTNPYAIRLRGVSYLRLGFPAPLFSRSGGSRLLAGVQITKEMPRTHRAHRRTSAYVEPVVGAFMKLFLALWLHCWEQEDIADGGAVGDE